jgi:chromosome segregation ATPase
VPKFKEGMAKELSSVIQACVDEQCWHLFSMQTDKLESFFLDLCRSASMITDKMDSLINRNAQNQNVLTELKLSQSHLIDDKAKLSQENATMLASMEQLQNQVLKMEESQSNYESILQERELLKINLTRVEQEMQELKPGLAKLQVDYNAMLEYNEELQVKVGDIAQERDEMRQLILDQGDESWLSDVRKSSVNLMEVRPSTPKRSLELVEEHRRRLDEAVLEEDQLDPEME